MTKTSTYMTRIVVAVGLLSLSFPAYAHDTVIGLSPHQSPETVKKQAEQVIAHLAGIVQPGEQAHVFDAANNRLLGIFQVPAKQAYSNPRAKLQANKALIGSLKRFIDGAEAVPDRIASIDLPGFLRTLRQNYPSEQNRAVIVLGSAIYDDPLAPSVSMQGGHVPNDGHISAGFGISPYGTAGISGTLEGTDIYFGLVGGSDWAVSSQHAYAVERFWTLSAEAHGASMAYMGDDLATLFGLARDDTPDRQHSAPLAETDKRFMIRFAPEKARASAPQPEPETIPAPEPVWRIARDVRIGLTWACEKCDLDLYVRAKPSAEVVYFGQQETPEATLHKDFIGSPSANGFETVVINGVVDLSKTKIAVNYYGGAANGASPGGEIKISIGDKVWAKPFQIKATRGNKGKGAKAALEQNTAPNDHWVLIDPLSVVAAE